MEKIIGIFNKEFVPVAFLRLVGDQIISDFIDLGTNDSIQDVLDGIQSTNNGVLSMRRENWDVAGGSIDIFMEEVLPSDKNYVYAVAERFGNVGFMAAVIYKDLQNLFIELGKKVLSPEEKNDLWSQMINIDETSAKGLLAFIVQIKPLVDKLEGIDKKWDDFVHKKQIEIRKASR
ncbi:MAG: hypothetical protein HY226_04055 [Candidatus Vogelbacteria bacterium]|nr:hypothetical protein [Candidatus Vogelbacteria bacterium]